MKRRKPVVKKGKAPKPHKRVDAPPEIKEAQRAVWEGLARANAKVTDSHLDVRDAWRNQVESCLRTIVKLRTPTTGKTEAWSVKMRDYYQRRASALLDLAPKSLAADVAHYRRRLKEA